MAAVPSLSPSDIAKIASIIHQQLHGYGSVEALFHFGAIAFLITIAYLGLDRLHAHGDNINDVQDKVKEDIEVWLPTLELVIQQDEAGGRKVTNPALVNRHAYVLLEVVNITVEGLGFKRGLYFLFRQGFVPGLNYFRKKQHIAWVSVFSLLSGAAFLTLVTLQIFDSSIIAEPSIQFSMDVIFALTCLVVVGSSMVHSLLKLIMKPRCARLKKRVSDDIAKWRRWLSPNGGPNSGKPKG